MHWISIVKVDYFDHWNVGGERGTKEKSSKKKRRIQLYVESAKKQDCGKYFTKKKRNIFNAKNN